MDRGSSKSRNGGVRTMENGNIGREARYSEEEHESSGREQESKTRDKKEDKKKGAEGNRGDRRNRKRQNRDRGRRVGKTACGMRTGTHGRPEKERAIGGHENGRGGDTET